MIILSLYVRSVQLFSIFMLFLTGIVMLFFGNAMIPSRAAFIRSCLAFSFFASSSSARHFAFPILSYIMGFWVCLFCERLSETHTIYRTHVSFFTKEQQKTPATNVPGIFSCEPAVYTFSVVLNRLLMALMPPLMPIAFKVTV